jgi:Arc/MetJ family transcription regulator
MAVTSVDIDTELLRLAKSAFGVKTNREAITLALSDIVRRQRQLRAIDAISRLDLEDHPQKIEYGS